jgi:threonine dehydrogenase-like Zn-dependent dehydrogenase
MLALAVFPEERRTALVEEPEPALTSPTSVRVRSLAVGLCGTDREICNFEHGRAPRGSDHLVLGHEALAEVVEVASGVHSLAAGDRVVPIVRRPCPHPGCAPCRSGRQDFCSTGDFLERGIKELHGYLRREAVDDQHFLVQVPASLGLAGVLTEPLSIAEKTLHQVWTVQSRLPWECRHLRPPGALQRANRSARGGADVDGRGSGARCHRALVLGAGPVGLLGAMALAVEGFELAVYSREPASSPNAVLARQIGARYLASGDVPIGELSREIGLFDLVYEATGSAELGFGVLTQLAANGVFVFAGVPPRGRSIELPASRIMRNLVLSNQVVLGTVNAGRRDYEAAAADLALFLARWPSAVRALFTGRHALQEAAAPACGPKRGIKDIVVFDGDLA